MKLTKLTAVALGLLMVLGLSQAFAQPAGFKRGRMIKGLKKGVVGLPGASLRAKLIKQAKRRRLKHKKITLASVNALLKKKRKGARGSFKALKLTTKIPVGKKRGARGKQREVTTEQYLKELNKYAKGFAEKGYATDGSGPDDQEVLSFDQNPRQLRQQRARLSRSFSRVGPLRTASRLSLPKRKRGARGKKEYRLLPDAQYIPGGVKAKRGARGKPKAEYRWDKKQVWGPYGDKSLAAIQVDASMNIIANKDIVQFKATAGADSWIFKKKKRIFRATGVLGGDNRKNKGKGEVYANLTIKILGKTHVLLDKKASGIKLGDKKSFYKEFGYTIRFVIVVIPVSVEVGASFEAGIRWSLNLLATKIQAEVTPYITSDAFARFAVDIFVAKAGIEGRVTLIDAEAKLHGEAGISGDQKGLYAYAYIAADLGISALKGAINAFVTVKWCIFACKKTYRAKIFGWKGFQKSWRLFKLEKKIYILGKKPKNLASGPSRTSVGKVNVKSGGGDYTCNEGKRSGASNCKVATVRLKYRCQPGKKGCPYWIDTKYNGVFKKAKKKRKKYVCDEGQRSGKKNCKVANINFKVKQSKKCTKKQGKKVPRKGCTYWIDTKYTGVFKKAAKPLRFNDKADPKCQRGIKTGGYCCPKACGRCGGKGCSKRKGGSKNCCHGKIKKSRRRCSKVKAPCRL